MRSLWSVVSVVIDGQTHLAPVGHPSLARLPQAEVDDGLPKTEIARRKAQPMRQV